ncbi:MAG TPA: hypothetical protein VIM55_13370 [Mucilaginibacter sp.]
MPVLLLTAAPLYAYTARALGAGGYPLQSGLGIAACATMVLFPFILNF